MAGSKNGSTHWYIQRLTAIIILPSFLWLDSTLFGVLYCVLVCHIVVGFETILEDYIHHPTSLSFSETLALVLGFFGILFPFVVSILLFEFWFNK